MDRKICNCHKICRNTTCSHSYEHEDFGNCSDPCQRVIRAKCVDINIELRKKKLEKLNTIYENL